MSKYVVLGGFLGAGKTTCMIAFSEYLDSQGRKAAILVNDLGSRDLVDGATTAEAGCCCDEVTGDCICYVQDTLVDKLRRFRDSAGADIIFSDIPGCGIGALDHVYHGLARSYPGEFVLCPFTAVADPERLRSIMPERADLHLPEEMRFLFDAQLKEAELILLNKIDTLDAARRRECLQFLEQTYPQARVMALSARTGEGVPEVVEYLLQAESTLPQPDIGYGSQAFLDAEAHLCWYDRKFFAKGAPVDGNAFIRDLCQRIREKLQAVGRNVPHLKVRINGNREYAKASLLGVDYDLNFDTQFTRPQGELRGVVNARATCESEVLDFLMDAALRETCEAYRLKLRVFFTECFSMVEEGND